MPIHEISGGPSKSASFVFLFFLLYVVFSTLACGDSSDNSVSQPVGEEVIRTNGLHVEGAPSRSSITLPQQIEGADWGVTEDLCRRAGYSLVPYAGATVSEDKYKITEKYLEEPLYLWVLSKDEALVCAFLTVREGSTMGPGGFAVNDPNIK